MPKHLKVLTWNIRHWGKNSALKNIIESIDKHDADISVITEYRNNQNWATIKNHFLWKWFFLIDSNPQENDNWILIISKTELSINTINYGLPNATHRWIDFKPVWYDMNILAVHIPWFWDKWWKEDFWKNLVWFANIKKDDNYIILWDYNTWFKEDSEWSPFKLSEYMYRLLDLNWTDTWRIFNKITEYSWYSVAKNWFRIDYIFSTKSLVNSFENVYFSHTERELKYSDHSMLICEVDI